LSRIAGPAVKGRPMHPPHPKVTLLMRARGAEENRTDGGSYVFPLLSDK
jgi:hypothetical protein